MDRRLSRRTLLAAVGALLVTHSLSAHAAGPGIGAKASYANRIRAIEHSPLGLTFHLELKSAPFPTSASSYQDASVFVFVPAHYRADRGGLAALVHFHGHNTSAERALSAHQLREQLVDSKQNAVLVVPQGPLFAADSSAGKLEAPGGLKALLEEVALVLSSKEAMDELGPAKILRGTGIGRVCLSGHSGGYHAVASCLKQGGVSVSEAYLFDALYAEAEVFKAWMLAGRLAGMPKRKLVSMATAGAPLANTEALMADLAKAGLRCVVEKKEGSISREDLVRADAVFLQSPLTHQDVTFEHNALRDCLYASSLPRHVKTSWFRAARGPRPIEKR